MATKEKVRITITPKTGVVQVTVETEKRGEMAVNLVVEAKDVEVIDQRTRQSFAAAEAAAEAKAVAEAKDQSRDQ